MVNKKDIKILQELVNHVREIVDLPIQEEKRNLWRKLNGLKPERPMVMIDQVCWNEMNVNDELTLQCTEPECRGYEEYLRRILYQWKYFPVDMVVEPFITVKKAINNTGFGIGVLQNIAVSDPTSSIVGHKFINQFETDDDLNKIKIPRISHDQKETDRRITVAHEIFDGFFEIKSGGMDTYVSLWDPISMWMGVENALYALVDKPDFMHKLVGKVSDGYMSMFTQLEEQGLLCEPQSLIHCTGAYTDELSASGYNPDKSRTKDIWAMGLAQMFSTVSPQMFKEFEVDYVSPICARFGLVYYGCCDPLDGKMNEVRLIPNVRKVSMSPWVSKKRGAMEIGNDFVYSCKPNPALLAVTTFNVNRVREDLEETRDICAKYGCPLEIILKDISTVLYQPERLFKWAEISMQVVLTDPHV
jgi:hypothetical protein